VKFSILLNFSEKKTARVFYTDPNLSIDPFCSFLPQASYKHFYLFTWALHHGLSLCYIFMLLKK
jgi:hypothetical protein